MRKLLCVLSMSLFIINEALTNGVAIVDANNGVYLTLISSKVETIVENQVSITRTTQLFRNDFTSDHIVKYSFPLPGKASATALRYRINDGDWISAIISPTPQDTTLPGPGGEIDENLKFYLGETPVFFAIPDTTKPEALLKVELSYVELLPYKFAKVQYSYPNSYLSIQDTPLDTQAVNFSLSSQRTISEIRLLSSQPVEQLSNNGNFAQIKTLLLNQPANQNYLVDYSLSLNELGLFGFSTFIPDSLIPDDNGGFFLFVAEPDPGNNNDVLNKAFTLIVDRSGSMSGGKIVQARNAATFVVNNLNEGDKFNIIDFSNTLSSFRNTHVEFNSDNLNAALSYITNFQAGGLTNISGAFELAVPQFQNSNDSTANIIIFFTDGLPTTGITNYTELSQYVATLIAQTETEIFLFTFGIGDDVNRQLLTQMASENNGLSEFLGDDELEGRITEFYLQIRNPVLISTRIAFSSPHITEVYPDPLPNLYKGIQMTVAGRYATPGFENVILSGTAFGDSVAYEYQIDLTDSTVNQYQFLTKIWAKLKIENLLVRYYLLDPNSEEAMILKQQIVEFSLGYGVITPFTSFSDPDDVTHVEESEAGNLNQLPGSFELLGNYPNPFNPSTKITFRVNDFITKNNLVEVKIYNALGQLIRALKVHIIGPGDYEVVWDGMDFGGTPVASGQYVYIISYGQGILAGKMLLLR